MKKIFAKNLDLRAGGKNPGLPLVALFTLLLHFTGCAQSQPPAQQNPGTKQEQQNLSNGGMQFHLRTETWENGERKIIDTTITMGDGSNSFNFSFPGGGDNPFGGFNFDLNGGDLNLDDLFGQHMPDLSDLEKQLRGGFNSPFNFDFDMGFPKGFEDLMQQQQKMMEEMMKNMPRQMPMPPAEKPKGKYDEEIIDL